MATLIVPESLDHALELEPALREAGINGTDKTRKGSEAWGRLLETQYERIVMGWSLTDISGLVLLNRIRRHPAYELTPVLIVSSRLLASDFRLLEELACVVHVSEARDRQAVARALGTLTTDAIWYRTNVPLVDAVLEMAQTNGAHAVTLLRDGIARAPNPVPLVIVAARALRRHGFAVQAEEVLHLLLARDARCLAAISELGKALYAQGRSEEAMVQLSEAHHLSPHNIGRLCLIGEVELSLARQDAAHRAFRAALDVDGNDPLAKAGVAATQTGTRLRPSAGDDVNAFFAGILNGKGIELVRAGRFADGISTYHAATAVLLRREDAAKVAFNVGLAYMRWRKAREAKPWFEQALDYSNGKLAKARRYLGGENVTLVGYDTVVTSVDGEPDLIEVSLGP